MAESFRLSPYREGDEQEILALFERVFGAPRSAAHWHWQFRDNPYGPPSAILARDNTSNQLVGQYTVMPVMLNVMGRPVPAGQSLDTMVDPDHRMHGIFEESARACYARLRESGCALVYGFPNQNSFPGLVRKLGWTRVALPVSYTLTLSIKDTLRRRLRIPLVPETADVAYGALVRARLHIRKALARRNNPQWRVSRSTSVPPGYDELWTAVKSFEILSVWKDAKYLAWRYDQHPSHAFTYHYVTHADTIHALCVTVRGGGGLHMLELIVRDRSVDLARYLIASVARHARGAGLGRLTFTGATLDFFDEAFRGFRREVGFGHVFCLLTWPGALPIDASDTKNWTVTEGDCDSY